MRILVSWNDPILRVMLDDELLDLYGDFGIASRGDMHNTGLGLPNLVVLLPHHYDD